MQVVKLLMHDNYSKFLPDIEISAILLANYGFMIHIYFGRFFFFLFSENSERSNEVVRKLN